jgi:hypothetical protein
MRRTWEPSGADNIRLSIGDDVELGIEPRTAYRNEIKVQAGLGPFIGGNMTEPNMTL